MLIQGKLTVNNSNQIKIPFYQRGHLSLMTGTEVTLCCLPPHDREPSLEELLISPIPYETWACLTRINARMEDNPYALDKLVWGIHQQGLAILYAGSGPIENNAENRKVHRIELLVDATSLYKDFGEEASDERIVLGPLERYLKAVCFDDLLLDGERMRLKVRPMEALRSVHAKPRTSRQSVVANAAIDQGIIILPQKLLHLNDRPHFLVSDTKDHIL